MTTREITMKIADSGSTLAVVAGDSVFLPPFKERLIYFRYFLICLNFHALMKIYIMLICRFSIQDHHDLKLYRLSSTIKNFVEIKKTDSLACIGNDQNAQCGGCFGFSNVLFWLQKANASTLDRRQRS